MRLVETTVVASLLLIAGIVGWAMLLVVVESYGGAWALLGPFLVGVIATGLLARRSGREGVVVGGALVGCALGATALAWSVTGWRVRFDVPLFLGTIALLGALWIPDLAREPNRWTTRHLSSRRLALWSATASFYVFGEIAQLLRLFA